MLSITPSLPAQSFEELRDIVMKLKGIVPMFQVDIVDGEFVPLRSWPFMHSLHPRSELLKLKELPEEVPLEIDCMIRYPEEYLDLFADLKIKSVVIHIGSTHAYTDIIMHARLHGYKIGLAITNDNDLEELERYIHDIDFVQVMGIAHVGKQGQPFDERTPLTIRGLHKMYPRLQIVVDGAVNADTVVRLRDAGASRLAPGSAIAKSSDPVNSYKQLCILLGI